MGKLRGSKLKIPRGILGVQSGTMGNVIVSAKVIRIKPDNKAK